MNNSIEAGTYINESGATWKAPQKKKPLRTFVAGLMLAGTIGASSPVSQDHYEEKKSAVSISTVHERIDPLPQNGVVVDFTKKREAVQDNEHLFTKEWLQEEVAKERDKPLWPGETPWYHLAGTGFWVPEQVSQLLRNCLLYTSDAADE